MATYKAFQAIRPKKGLEQRIAALPYDVYSREEAKAEVLREPLSFLTIDRAETAFADNVSTYDPRVYEKAGELLWKMVEEGKLQKDGEKSYYLYELTMDGRTQTGLVGLASIDDYNTGVIKKHEKTRADKEEDRVRHVEACHAQTGPIFLAYRANQALRRLTDAVKRTEPEFAFTSPDGVVQRGFCITDPEMTEAIATCFAEMPELYIADGHHRAASAVRVGMAKRAAKSAYTGDEEFNYFLSVAFPDEELLILDYNRVVRDLNGYTEGELLEKIAEDFVVTPLKERKKPERKGQMTMYLKENWYLLEPKEKQRKTDPVADLDVSLLYDRILAPILGIGDPKTDARIDFVGGVRGLSELERRVHTDMAVAFAMYPTSISELFAVADAGRLMPPKSTWFEPKLRSGLFIHELEEN